jgi:hypothetical protein
MVVLPYKERVQLFELVSKQLDLDGKAANQGLIVLDNK